MGLITLPQRLTSQPQYSPALAEAYQDAELLSLFNDGTGKDLAKGNHLIPGGGVPVRVLRQQGYSLNFEPGDLISTRDVAIAYGDPGFTVFAWVRPDVLNVSYRRIIETDFRAGFYIGSSATGGKYAWIVNNSSLGGCVGGQQVAGQRDFVCGTFDGANRVLYVNGVQVASAPAARLTSSRKVTVGSNAIGSEGWSGDIDTIGIFFRVFPPSEIRSLYQNPWQLLKAPARRIVVAAMASGINLTSTASTQANIGGAGAIIQIQTLAGAASATANAASIGAITLGAISELTGAASIQGNTNSSVAITQAHGLTVSASAQGGTSSAVAITQVHGFAGAASAQGNLGGIDAIALDSGYLEGIPSTQHNISASAAISAIHILTTAVSTLPNLSGIGAISDGIVVEPALITGAAKTIRVKKPGIPAGTPEWLKTMLEILTGRRGNEIQVPPFQALTFSATPTKAECETLYAYINSVRSAVEQLISRMDG